jgi:hypothetical protein
MDPGTWRYLRGVSAVDDHARYREYQRVLAGWEALDEARVSEFVGSALSDRVGESAVIDLIGHAAVTEEVLDAIEPQLPEGWKAARDRLHERRVRLPLERGLTDEANLLAAVNQGSRNVQLWLLDNIDLSRTTLERLAADGATRAIRNRASERLRGF